MNAARESPAISAALAWEILPNSYHFTHAARVSSVANCAGLCLRLEKAVSGKSKVTFTKGKWRFCG